MRRGRHDVTADADRSQADGARHAVSRRAWASTAHTALFAAGATLLAAVLLAATPSLRLAFREIREGLSDGGRGAASRFWRRLGANLVVVELAVAVVLLAGAGLLAKSFYRLLHVETGFDTSHLATVYVMAPDNVYSKPEQQVALYHQILEKISALPGVQSAAITSDLPLQCNCDTDWIRIPGKPFHGEHNEVLERDVSPQYLAMLKARLVRGRMFTEADDANHPQVTILNESMAQKYFPGEDPIGKMIGDGGLSPKSMRQVVGVIEDVREGAPDDEAWPAEYFSIYHGPDQLLRSSGTHGQDENAVLPVLVKTLRGINPNLGVYGESTMTAQMSSFAKRPVASILHLAGGRVCGVGPGVGSRGALWSGRIFGEPENARDRRADGAGCATGRYPPAHPERGGMADGNGDYYRAGMLRCGGDS